MVYYDDTFGEITPKELQPKAFRSLPFLFLNDLIGIFFTDTQLMKPHTQSKRCFTGRDLKHLSICGYKTQGDRAVYDPSRNLFEMAHIYHHLQNPHLNRFNIGIELLVHVVAKKSLWAHLPFRPLEAAWEKQKKIVAGWKDRFVKSVDKWLNEKKHVIQTGQLIPFSFIQKDGNSPNEVWYYVAKMTNDRGGNLNYVLLPVNRRYAIEEDKLLKESPLVMLYRSTASDPEAVDSYRTVLADMNPSGIGSLRLGASDEQDLTHFNRCTMPTWVGYLILGDFNKAIQDLDLDHSLKETAKFASGKHLGEPLRSVYAHRRDSLRKFIAQQKTLLEDRLVGIDEISDLIRDFLNFIREEHKQGKIKFTPEDFKLFISYSLEAKEWDMSKVMQDIHFMGHSLGGVFVQQSLHRLCSLRKRIPLIDCKYQCSLYDAPGRTKKDAHEFITFGRDHRELLTTLRQKWEINYHFEKEDSIPLGGEAYVGTFEYTDADQDWLKVSGVVYTPLTGGEAGVAVNVPTDSAIVAMSAHGRRFALAQEGQHYLSHTLTATELNDFKPNLTGAMRRVFGFQDWYLPGSTEKVRRVAGALNFAWPPTLYKMARNWVGRSVDAELDANGVMTVSC